MKLLRKHRWKKRHHYLPVVAHVMELVLAVVIFAGGQNLWAELVGANPDITPPSIPVNLTVSGRSATDISITWDASTDDVGVTGYHVFRNGTQVGSPATNSFDDTGLTPNTGYSYTVTAFDAATNESAASAALPTSTLVDASPPSIPSNLHQTGSTISSVSIAWNPSTDNVGVTSYEIFRNGSLIRTQSGTTYTDSGLAVYTSYTYTITAHDAATNSSNLSQPLYAATAQDTNPPSVPDNIHKTSSTITSVTLAWDAASDNVGVSGYHVYRNGALVGSPGGNGFTDTGLGVGTSYTYTISAFDSATNESAQSAPFSADSSSDTTPPTIPSNLHTTTVHDDSISLGWDASTDDVSVTGYKIYRDGSLVGTSATTSYTDSGLMPFTNYSYRVIAYDAANNNSTASAALPTQTAYDTTAPTTPGNLASSTQTDTTISLTWDLATDNIAVSGYDVYRDGSLITSTVGTNYTDSALDVNTSYSYKVRAHDASGNNSAQSIALNVSTLTDQIAPTAPTGLGSSAQTTTSIDLSWTAATDDVAVVSYNVYRGATLITNVAGTTYSDSGLHYNTTYGYTVVALDAANNPSPASAVYSIATLPDTTAPVVSLTAPGNGETKQLIFGISATASDDLDLNRVVFYADSTQIASITSAPFAFNWNSYAVHNGSHTITAKAYDATGNTSTMAATITINNPPPPLTGDLNGDHKINIFDLSTLLSHWNKSGAGDFNNNGRVDIFDLSVLLSRYGQDNSGYN
jgi:chitodextrinase